MQNSWLSCPPLLCPIVPLSFLGQAHCVILYKSPPEIYQESCGIKPKLSVADSNKDVFWSGSVPVRWDPSPHH